LAIFNGPVFGWAPGVGALIIKDDEFFGFAVVSDVGSAVTIEIGDDERGDALFGGDGFDTESGIGRKLVHFLAAGGFEESGKVGFAALIIEEIDFGAGIVDDDQVVQTIAVEVGNVKLADLGVNGIDFGTGETEGVVGIGRSERAVGNAKCEKDKGGGCANR
jgi:hypothetical protein